MSKRGTASVNWDVVADLGYGESLVVVGNQSALGSGNVENGLSLVTSKEYWPIWRSHKPLQVKLGEKLSYRLAVFSGGQFSRWGNSGESFIPTSAEVMVEDEIEASTQTITTSFSDKMSITNLNKKKKRRIRHTSSGRSHRADSMDTDEDGTSSPRVVAFAPLPKHHKSDKTQRVVSKIRLQSNQKSAAENETRDESLSPISRKRARGFGTTSFEESSKKRHGTYLSGKDGVVIVVRVLPLVIRKESNGQWFVKWNDEDLNVATELGYSLSSVKQMSQNDDGNSSPRHLGAVKMRVQWVGMPRISTTQSARMDATISMQDRMELQDILSNFGCIPVWASSEIMRCHHVFCTEILRPVIHNVYDPYGKLPTRLWKKENHSEIWRAYTAMCNEFAKAIVAIHHEGDMIWIQGFHLLILPSILARKIPTATTGIYFDSPFPSSEIFRTLSMREDLMRGLLNADQICFAQYASARHFQACCRRIMGLSHEIDSRTGAVQVTLQGRRVVISVSHPGIELERLNKYAEHVNTNSLPRDVLQNDRIRPHADRVWKWIHALKQQSKAGVLRKQKPMLILSLGLLGDALMGHELRMVAARRLLETMPQYRGQIYFLDIAIQEDVSFQKNSASFDLDDNARLKRLYDLSSKVNDIHHGTYEFITMPPLPTSLRILLYSVADVFLSTPVRQGVDLYPLEYSYVRKDSRGALIASEFSTYSHVLHGSMFVNPWKMEDLIRAFTFCFSMSDAGRQRRMSHSARFITNTSMSLWVYRMLIDLKRCRKRADKFKFKGYGLGLRFRLIAEAEGFSSLNTKAVTRSWSHTKQRVLFLDFRGTIAPYSLNGRRSDAFESRVIREKRLVLPSVQMRRNLVTLASDPRTHVFILSGLETEFLDEAFAEFTGVSFVAEHGFFYRRGTRMRGASTPTSSIDSKQQNQWRMLLADFKIDLSWIAIVRNIMEVYQQRTMGSRIEQKTSALVWDHSNADSDFAKIQASNMIVQLKPILRNFAVDILEGKGYVEVRQRGVNKGASAMSLLNSIESRSGQIVDFILCLGDDSSDETMFTELRNKRGTVGKKPSKAEYYVHDVDDVEMLINTLAHQSAKGKASRSMVDLRRLGKSPVRPSSLLFRKVNLLGTSPGESIKRKRHPSSSGISSSLDDKKNTKQNDEMDTEETTSSSFMMSRTASMPFIARRADGTSIQDAPSTLNDFLEDLDNDDEEDDMMGGLFF